MISTWIKIKNDKATFDRKIITLILQVLPPPGVIKFGTLWRPIWP